MTSEPIHFEPITTSTPLTTTTQTTSSDPLLNIPSSGISTSLPAFDIQEGFGFEFASTSSHQPPPTSDGAFNAYHMAPITIEDSDDENLDDGDFVFIKQYKTLNKKFDILLQTQTGYDPKKTTEGDMVGKIDETKKETLRR